MIRKTIFPFSKMNLKQEQAKEYLNEAKLTLASAEAIFDKAETESLNLWSKVFKNAYDAVEDALSAAIAYKGEIIPKEHPGKVSVFIRLWKPPQKTIELLFKWLGKRSSAQYVDIKDGKINVPSKLFGRDDALIIISDAKEIIILVEKLIFLGR